MERRISATEARIHLGEVMRRVVEQGERVIIEKDGRPHVVMLSIAEFERVKDAHPQDDWEQQLEQILVLGNRIKARRGGRPLTPSPEEATRQMREERGAQLTSLP
jgi:prevent-host-death family protein